MIIVNIDNGLGNQLFQYAFGRYLAEKHHSVLKLDCHSSNEFSNHSFYKLNAFNIQENFASHEDLDRINRNDSSSLTKDIKSIKEYPVNGKLGAFIPEFMDCPDNVYLEGFWQSEKYFVEISDIIRREFALKNPLSKNSSFWKDKIMSTNYSVSLHIRHGGYLDPERRIFNGILSMNFYNNCIKELKKLYPQITVFVFSDDLDWAKSHFRLDAPMEFVEGCEFDYEEIYLMSICKHNIVSQGTFAWWGAWLNQNPDKKVFAPNPWHLGNWGADIIPKDWIKIDADYNKNPHVKFPPLLSIITYVENDISDIEITLSSIFTIGNFNQEMELIIVDKSTDGSGQICRRSAGMDNVTFIRLDSEIEKATAYNKALNSSRGEYVLFLKSKDFINPYTFILLAKFWKHNFDTHEDVRGSKNFASYLHYAKYSFDGFNMPDIIYSTQIFEEDSNGTIALPNFGNKKFTIKVDEQFRSVQTFLDLKISDAQKLIMIATQQINNFIGAKFFKRIFLEKNHIRFNESCKENFELIFLINTFMLAKDIKIMPNAFYGFFK